jgi:hypothetical protein
MYGIPKFYYWIMYGIAGNLEVGSLESILGKWNLMRDGTGI